MMMMMMIVMMMAMTPRIEARLSPFCLMHIVCARRLSHEAPGKQRTPERRPAKLRLLEATVHLRAKSISA